MSDTISAADFRKIISAKKFVGQRTNFLIMRPRQRTVSGEYTEFGKDRPYLGKEDTFQRHAVNVLRCLPCRPFVIHVPNGGSRKKVEAAILKAMGVVAGVPDLLVFEAANGYNGLAIELKVEGGSVKEKQAECIAKLQSKGWFCCVVWSYEGLQEAIGAYFGENK